MEPNKLFVTVKQFTKLYPWPTEAGLWGIRADQENNGFENAFVKMGRRVLVDVNVFWECLERNNKEKK